MIFKNSHCFDKNVNFSIRKFLKNFKKAEHHITLFFQKINPMLAGGSIDRLGLLELSTDFVLWHESGVGLCVLGSGL